MTSIKIFEVVIEVIVLLGVYYLLFFKKFIEELGKQTAELALIREKTLEVEQIRFTFNSDLEKIKQELQLYLGEKLEPLKSELSILANKHGQIFLLEKETIVEFNAKINSFIWEDMGLHANTFTKDNFTQIDELRQQLTKSYYSVQVHYNKMSLIVDDEELNKKAYEAISQSLALKHFIDEILVSLRITLEKEKKNSEDILELLKDPQKSSPDSMIKLDENDKTFKSERDSIMEKWNTGYISFFKSAIESVRQFKTSAKTYIKLNVELYKKE